MAGFASISVAPNVGAGLLVSTPESSQDEPDDSPLWTLETTVSPAFADVAYLPNGGQRQTLDIYLPTGRSAATLQSGPLMPVLVWIHGGGWIKGRKNPGLPWLLDDGYAIVGINYRLLQDAPFPAQIVDANAAIAWVWQHADDYGFDRNRLVVGGSSAGARSTLLVGLAEPDEVPEFEADPEVRIAALIDFFGGLGDRDEIEAPLLQRAIVKSTMTQEEIEAMGRQINILPYVEQDDPTTLIVHGDQDARVPVEQSRELAAAMDEAGMAVTYREMPGRGHGIDGYQDEEIQGIVRAFLDETLGPA